jgi:hypothetical protein
MKTTRLLLLMFVLAGCANKEGGPVRESSQPSAATSVVHGSMSATVDGEKWVAEGTPSEKSLENVEALVDPHKGYLTITGHQYHQNAVASDADDQIQVTVKTLAPGTYELAPDFNNVQTGIYSKGSDTSKVYFIHEGQSGQVILDRVDTGVHRLFGTFHFTARNSKGEDIHIENGSFDNVKYQ